MWLEEKEWEKWKGRSHEWVCSFVEKKKRKGKAKGSL